MKQMPPSFNHQMPFRPTGNMMGWTPYQQAAQQMANPSPLAESTPKTGGLMSLLKKLNPVNGNFSQTLDQIHQVIKMTQSVTPKLQEYAPLIKNIPAMLELMKEFDESDENNGSTEQDDNDDDSTAELDAILGIDDEEELEQDQSDEDDDDDLTKLPDEANKSEVKQSDDLYKIESIEDQKKPKYKGPTLYI